MKVKDFVGRIPLRVRKIDGKYLAYYPGWDVRAEGDTEEKARTKARAAAEKKLNALVAGEISAAPKRPDIDFWKHKTADELSEEQGIKPIKDKEDLSKRIIGGLEEWDDIDGFLEEVHRPWGKYAR
jgi:hypothetical protein